MLVTFVFPVKWLTAFCSAAAAPKMLTPKSVGRCVNRFDVPFEIGQSGKSDG
jgi:hypothetical protein